MNGGKKFSCKVFVLGYLHGVGIMPFQSVAGKLKPDVLAVPGLVDTILFEELWRKCDAAACGLTFEEFSDLLISIGSANHYGIAAGATPRGEQQTTFFRSLRLADLVLARACAQGKELAWERFLALYRQPLTRAAVAITGSDTLGRDLADALYAELYGLTTRDGLRRCPLDSYMGRGSLLGWLRTTLAQRHVDHHRRTYREAPLEDYDSDISTPESESSLEQLPVLARAIEDALRKLQPEESFLLASYYLDERTLLQIARVLDVHEATVSRKLRRLMDNLRKQILRNLQRSGLSRRAAAEALAADPRDLTCSDQNLGDLNRRCLNLNLKKLLQHSQSGTFPEKAGR